MNILVFVLLLSVIGWHTFKVTNYIEYGVGMTPSMKQGNSYVMLSIITACITCVDKAGVEGLSTSMAFTAVFVVGVISIVASMLVVRKSVIN